MTHPTVSVLMAVFNTDRYLGDAINSVLSQTLEDLELVIIDDGSTDDSWSMITAAASRDPRVVALRQPSSGGASRALNRGLAVARGHYITRQDSDDVSSPTRLDEQVAFLDAHPDVGGVGTQAVLIDCAGNPLRVTALPEDDVAIQSTLGETMSVLGPTIMVRRSAFVKAGFRFDEELSGSEDYDLCLRLGEVSQLANLSGQLYLYRQHSSSVSRSQRQRQLCRKAMALEKALRRRFGATAPATARLEVARDYLRAAIVAHTMGDSAGRTEYLQRSLSTNPEIVAQVALVEKIVRRYTPAGPHETALRFTKTLFEDVLPRSRELGRLQRQLVSELHARVVFAAPPEWERIRHHWWLAVRLDPKWMLHRGFWATAVKGLLRNPSAPKPPAAAA